jgi:hypothetical protein
LTLETTQLLVSSYYSPAGPIDIVISDLLPILFHKQLPFRPSSSTSTSSCWARNFRFGQGNFLRPSYIPLRVVVSTPLRRLERVIANSLTVKQSRFHFTPSVRLCDPRSASHLARRRPFALNSLFCYTFSSFVSIRPPDHDTRPLSRLGLDVSVKRSSP